MTDDEGMIKLELGPGATNEHQSRPKRLLAVSSPSGRGLRWALRGFWSDVDDRHLRPGPKSHSRCAAFHADSTVYIQPCFAFAVQPRFILLSVLRQRDEGSVKR